MSNNITDLLPPMLTGAELNRALRQLPEAPTDDFRRNATQTERLIALSDLYDVFIPNQMAEEIYTKLYISLMQSLAKKQTKLATIQANQNHIAANGGIGKLGIMGGVDVFSVTGVGGIGKSSAISRSISVITRNSVIETAEPYSRIIPVLTVQCPYDCSVKGLLFSILTGVDNLLETNYVQRSIRTRATTDMMIAQLANTCLEHVGLAQYITEVFRSPLSQDNDTPIGDFLQSRLEPPYITPRGIIRNMEQLQRDFLHMYNGIDLDGFGDIVQITKIFEEKRIIANEICALAMLIGIPPDDLSAPALPTISRTEAIDRSIRDLREKGYTFKRISEELGLPIYTCKDVGSDRCRRR